MGNLSFMAERMEMVKVAKNMWDRKLTNAAGGNFAYRVANNRVLISPSLMSERKFCDLNACDFLLIDYDMNILEGSGNLSREAYMHVLLLKNFKNIGATIHAHPQFCMVFVAQSKPIRNITEATMKRGPVECIPYTKAYTKELHEQVYEYFDNRRELAEEQPIGAIMPMHGVVVSGPDLHMAYSMLERIEADAICNLFKNFV
ncbi:class II aldolase/adducin family protein [Diplocloster modestus]|uniref:Class II aldolase/adducin family protein n=1 Tax=Diplocloster modestus TaxID=2850322 RepID=A0ABS6K8L2_9FIRM|nr:class II aldolase/adducin family protein [Diplocloster modestus]MBU9726860.1 class II aldolase/adducin family protein [Diplocloster modestus]